MSSARLDGVVGDMMNIEGFWSREWRPVTERSAGRWPHARGQSLRFDPGPGVNADDCPLRDLFRQWSGATPRERRHCSRHEASGLRVWLGWRMGGREFLAAPADLLNISEGGALVRLTTPLSRFREVWVCLGDPAEADEGVLATTLDVTRVRDGQWVARLEFDVAAAEDFIEPEPTEPPRQAAPR